MKRFIALAVLVVLGVLSWRISSLLSSDAVGMAVGIVFGVLAGLPSALLALTFARHRESRLEEEAQGQQFYGHQPQAYPFQPPVVIVTGTQQQHPAQQSAGSYLPMADPSAWKNPPGAERQFKIVGEQEEWVR